MVRCPPRSAVIAGLAVLAAGCVSKAKYDALEAQLDATRVELQREINTLQGDVSERDATLATLQRALGESEIIAERLGDEIKVLTRTKQALEAQLKKAQTERAAALADKSKLASSIEEMQQALEELTARKAAAEARMQEYRDLLDRFAELIDAGKLQVRIAEGRMIVQLATDILFASGSAALSKDGAKAVEEVAAVLATIPDRTFQVEGHTDNDPIRSQQYPSNWELASGRAINVVKAMVGAGMPPDRVSAASYGEYDPVDTNRTPEGKAANRRIQIVVMPDLSSLPGFEELTEVGG